MGEIRVCRICLIMDVKMHELQTFALNTFIEQMIGRNTLTTGHIPSYACYECLVLLKKHYVFRERCLLSQSLLDNILRTNGQITAEEIRQLDRHNLKLTSSLEKHKIPIENILTLIYEDIKQECDIKDERGVDNESNEVKVTLKQEYISNDFLEVSSSDDELLLSLHKKCKEKKEKLRVKKAKKTEVDDGKDITEKLQDEASTDFPQPPKKRGRQKKTNIPGKVEKSRTKEKRRRTKKTEDVEEDGPLEEYFTVIELTLEQQLEEIRQRQHSSNYVDAPYQCAVCFKGFVSEPPWRHHRAKHDPSTGELECEVCKFRFKRQYMLNRHRVNHEQRFACRACSHVAKCSQEAKLHQKWHNGFTYKCQHCGEVFSKRTSYLSHVRIKHPSEFICGICGYSFVSKLGLTMHRTMMHKDAATEAQADGVGVDAGPYCQECDVKFVSVEAYKRHMVTSAKHMTDKDSNAACRECGEILGSPEELRVHHKAAHARKWLRKYGSKARSTWPAKCEHCSVEVSNGREYYKHYLCAHPDKKYPVQGNHVCDICGKRFQVNAALGYHKRTHLEEKAFRCAHAACGKAFHNRANLRAHARTHLAARPHACALCHKAFKFKGALNKHLRAHTGVKPYVCEVCGKGFTQSNSRKLHVRTVHLKQPAPYVSRSRLERRRQAARDQN